MTRSRGASRYKFIHGKTHGVQHGGDGEEDHFACPSGSTLDGRGMDVSVDVDVPVEDSTEEDSDPEVEVRQRADPARLPEIVSLFARCLFAIYTVNRGK